jgi:ribosomal protein S21
MKLHGRTVNHYKKPVATRKRKAKAKAKRTTAKASRRNNR